MTSGQDQEMRELRIKHWNHSQAGPAVQMWDKAAEVDLEGGGRPRVQSQTWGAGHRKGLLRGWVGESKRGDRGG